MVRKSPQPEAVREEVLECVQRECLSCSSSMWNKYDNYRTVRTLTGVVRLRLKVRRCQNRNCERFHQAYRPEQEGKWALPQHEFGLDVIAFCGTLRYQQHHSVTEIYQQLQQRGICISERSVSYLIQRYDELLALGLSNKHRLQEIVRGQKQVKKRD